MFNDLLDGVKEELQDEKMVRGGLQFFAWLIILAVVALCEIMYVRIMVIGFPDGLFRILAITGAVATGASIIVLYAAKNYWFSKGHQSWAAWFFTGVEVAILVLNVILAFNFNSTDPVLTFWKSAYPAAPIVALVGWGIILYFDKTNIMRRRQREQQEQQHQAELKYNDMVHKVRLHTKTESLKIVAGKLEAKMQSHDNQHALEQIADTIYNGILSEISNTHITSIKPAQPQLPPSTNTAKDTSPLSQPRMENQPNYPSTNGNK